MKKIKIATVLLVASIIVIIACKKAFLDRPALGSLAPGTMANKKGVEGLLVGAYSLLDGWPNPNGDWGSSATNWVYGGVASDEAYKGSDAGDQPPINSIQNYTAVSTNPYFDGKWKLCYDGVQRANDVLRVMALATDISSDDQTRITAEARFLRGYYHLELKKVFNMVPYVDETITYDAGNFKLKNDQDIWPQIEADFQFAYDNLEETQPQVGRANKWAAAAFLAKAYIFQAKYAAAKPLLATIIASGKTARGDIYGLMDNFYDNFDLVLKNNKESVFAIQNSANDGAGGENAGWTDNLNHPYGVICCGFYQPSVNLVNAYKTDAATGLPDPDHFNDADFKSDQGIASAASFTPDVVQTIDPRLDWTATRRGVPYLDWGINPGKDWVRDQDNGGPYGPKKNMWKQSQVTAYVDASFWNPVNGALAEPLIRFADILLWAAECEVEAGDLNVARGYVNQIRTRAGNFAQGPGTSNSNISVPINDPSITWAKYKIGLYTAPWTDQTAARTAVRFERRLEFAMEGNRHFDLVRWGIADVVINAYIAKEKLKRSFLIGANFVKGKHEYFPIPQAQIDVSNADGTPTLTQNPGY